MKPPNLSVGGKPLLRKVYRYPVAEPRRGACSEPRYELYLDTLLVTGRCSIL